MSLCKISAVDAKVEAVEEQKNSSEDTSVGTVSSDVQSANGEGKKGYKGKWDYNGDGGRELSKYDHLFKKAGKTLGLDWRLVAAHSLTESSWKGDAANGTSTSGGLYGIIDSTWKGSAPKGYEDPSNKNKPDIATELYITLMKEKLNRFKNAESRNAQILLTLQSYHDGNIGGTSWPDFIKNKHSYGPEGVKYVPTVMKHYKKLGGDVIEL